MPEYTQREVLDKHEAADYLRVSVFTLIRRAKEGVIGRRLGRDWRFTMSELRDYAAGRLPSQLAERGAQNEQVRAGDVREAQTR